MPIFPAATASRPSPRSRRAVSAVTVDFPLVPVMAMYRSAGMAWSATSISPMIGSPASRACSSGGEGGARVDAVADARVRRVHARALAREQGGHRRAAFPEPDDGDLADAPDVRNHRSF